MKFITYADPQLYQDASRAIDKHVIIILIISFNAKRGVSTRTIVCEKIKKIKKNHKNPKKSQKSRKIPKIQKNHKNPEKITKILPSENRFTL
jgi:hypothetical protein